METLADKVHGDNLVELTRLARDMLAPSKADRPDAAEVLARLSALLDSGAYFCEQCRPQKGGPGLMESSTPEEGEPTPHVPSEQCRTEKGPPARKKASRCTDGPALPSELPWSLGSRPPTRLHSSSRIRPLFVPAASSFVPHINTPLRDPPSPTSSLKVEVPNGERHDCPVSELADSGKTPQLFFEEAFMGHPLAMGWPGPVKSPRLPPEEILRGFGGWSKYYPGNSP
jgi:hypothetical protein